jgi:hypothetical protein
MNNYRGGGQLLESQARNRFSSKNVYILPSNGVSTLCDHVDTKTRGHTRLQHRFLHFIFVQFKKEGNK